MFNDYKIQRNQTLSMIKKSKKNFYNRSILENKTPKFLWKNLKCISNADSNKGNDIVIPNCIGNSDQEISGEINVINELNRHFVNISQIVKKTKFEENKHFQ